MNTTSTTSSVAPIGPTLLTPEIFRQHREEAINAMGTKAVSKTVGEILYRVWPYRVGQQIPAGMVMPLRVSLRQDYAQWLKAEYFLRPIEGTASHGLVVELILILDPSDQELDLLADILVPHVADCATVANCILGRIAQPKYKLLDEKLTASILRARVLGLVALITTKALLLRSSGATT